MNIPGSRWLCLAALALMPHGAALAADTIRGDRFTTATLPLDRELQYASTIDSVGDSDWWRVTLTAGKSYILRSTAGGCNITVTVYNSAGGLLKNAPCYGAYQAGLEFIAPYTGTYFVGFAGNGRASSYPYYYYPDALNDCAGSSRTTCTQPIDSDFSTRLQTRSDSDWRAINLRAGQTYTAAATNGDSFFLSVRKADGSILGYRSGYNPRLVFRAPTTGRYFVEVKSTQDTYWGSRLVFYMVATGDVPNAAPAQADTAPRTLAAAKAAAGIERTD